LVPATDKHELLWLVMAGITAGCCSFFTLTSLWLLPFSLLTA